MRNRQLHAALAAFAEESAHQLAADTAAGAEVPFEVVELAGSRREAPLYCYRPLTGGFIEERRSILGRLPSFLPAVHALAACGGLDAYLVACGESRVPGADRARAEYALRLFLTRVFEDSGDFELSPERLARAYEDLESAVMDGRALTEVVAPLLGLALTSDEIALGDGLALVCADACPDAPREALFEREDGHQVVLARLTWESAPGDEAPLRHAQVRLRRLLTALRLYDAAGIVLARTAWTRTGGGGWQPFAMAGGAVARGVCVIPPQQEDELRAFLSLVGRRTPRGGELAWALQRFELATDRGRPSEALTDVLLALRALLEPEGPRPGGWRAAWRRCARSPSSAPRSPSASRTSSRWSARSSPASRPRTARWRAWSTS
ncbi:hypothetical protein FSW04_08900 [Baekduia soli]|uniref:Uncharacterized protein n=1 Tax=Baekduia soli TaxID=496014 RepID=A0A5B8U3V4_9ACTN|nr:hypothetical protein [Baekduia soli]QEC47680.1 hypothetical protein FSW04_08900 [Baekduia soli]